MLNTFLIILIGGDLNSPKLGVLSVKNSTFLTQDTSNKTIITSFNPYAYQVITNNFSIYFTSYVYLRNYKIQYSNDNVHTTEEYNHITYQFQKCIPVIQIHSFFKILERYTIH